MKDEDEEDVPLWTREEVNIAFEGEILKGLITSDSYCEKVFEHISMKREYFKNKHYAWAFEKVKLHYMKIGHAPKEGFPALFYGESVDVSDDTRAFLHKAFRGIDDEYENNPDAFQGEAISGLYEMTKTFCMKREIVISASSAISIAEKSNLMNGEKTDEALSIMLGIAPVVKETRLGGRHNDPEIVERAIAKGRDELGERLFILDGIVGEIIGPFHRKGLSAFLGFTGGGKTWMLLECAIQAYQQGLNVFFGTLEQSTEDMEERFLANIAKVSIYPGLMINPIFDCLHNQYGTCDNYRRWFKRDYTIPTPDQIKTALKAPKNAILLPQPNQKAKDQEREKERLQRYLATDPIIKLIPQNERKNVHVNQYTDNPYKPCTLCRKAQQPEFAATVWGEVDIADPFSKERCMRSLERFDKERDRRPRGASVRRQLDGIWWEDFGLEGPSTDGIFRRMEIIERTQDIKFDVCIIDYADIMGDPKATAGYRMEYRDKHNKNWNQMKNLAKIKDIGVITATQSNRQGFGDQDIDVSNTSEDIRKVHVVDKFIIIQQTKIEEKNSVCRINMGKYRQGKKSESDQVMVLQNFNIGRTILDTAYVADTWAYKYAHNID